MTEVRKMLTLDELLAKIPVSRTTLWRMQRDNQFPKARIVRGQRTWYSDEVEAWQAGLPPWIIQRVSRPAK